LKPDFDIKERAPLDVDSESGLRTERGLRGIFKDLRELKRQRVWWIKEDKRKGCERGHK